MTAAFLPITALSSLCSAFPIELPLLSDTSQSGVNTSIFRASPKSLNQCLKPVIHSFSEMPTVLHGEHSPSLQWILNAAPSTISVFLVVFGCMALTVPIKLSPQEVHLGRWDSFFPHLQVGKLRIRETYQSLLLPYAASTCYNQVLNPDLVPKHTNSTLLSFYLACKTRCNACWYNPRSLKF